MLLDLVSKTKIMKKHIHVYLRCHCSGNCYYYLCVVYVVIIAIVMICYHGNSDCCHDLLPW